MSRNQKVAYVIGSVAVMALVWIFTPIEALPREVWGIGMKTRLMGFVLIILLAFYFFFDKIVFHKKR